MTTREKLHKLVDELPENEVRVALRILEALEERDDPVRAALENAPEDDEPFDPSQIEREDEGPPVPHDEARRRLLG